MSKTDINIDEKGLFDKIFKNIINPFVLPVDLFTQTATILNNGVAIGFAGNAGSGAFFINELNANIWMFSAAKTFQQTLAMNEALTENGQVVSFSKFRKKAQQIFDTYNKTYLRTEYDSAILQSQNASRWLDIQENKELFTLLKYDATNDSLVCPICRPLDGIVKPVNDPFWATFYPMNHFNCRCNVMQLEEWEDKPSKNTRVIENQVSKVMDPMFKFNPGMEASIFMDKGPQKHPYFSVPKKYAKFAKTNFGLKPPKK